MQHSKQFYHLKFQSNQWTRRAAFPSLDIGPTIAKELLELNTSNRPLRSGYIKELAREMMFGKWMDNGEPIKISVTGKLMDAQHRLHAVIQSGCTVKMDLVTGIADEAFSTIDINRTRTAADTAATMGFKNYTTISGAVKHLIAWRENSQTFTQRSRINNQDVADFLKDLKANNPRELQSIENSVTASLSLKSKSTFFGAAAWAFLHIVLSKIDYQQAHNFLFLLASGDGVSSSDPETSSIYHLRAKFINMAGQKGFDVPLLTYRFALTFKVWNWYREKRLTKLISWSDREPFPQPK